jgi:hypothetical protein
MLQDNLYLIIPSLVLIMAGGVAIVLNHYRREKRARQQRSTTARSGYGTLPPQAREGMDREAVEKVKTLQEMFFKDAYNLAAPHAPTSSRQKQVREELRSLGLQLYSDGGAGRVRQVLGRVDSHFQDVVRQEWRSYDL